MYKTPNKIKYVWEVRASGLLYPAIPPPTLFRTAPIPCKLAELKHLLTSPFCNLTAQCSFIHDTCALMPLDISRTVTTVNRFIISTEISLFFSPSASFPLLICSEVSEVTEKTLHANQIYFGFLFLKVNLTHC